MSYFSPTLKFSPPSDISVSKPFRAWKNVERLHFSNVAYMKLSE